MHSLERFSPVSQFFIFFVATLLVLIYLNGSFKNQEYNKLCLGYGIFIYLWWITIVIRFLYIKGPQDERRDVWFEVPYGAKCLLNEKGCNTADFGLFSVFHIIGYILLGMYVPNQYLIIFIGSILCELWEYFLGFQAKFILDPAINLIGYTIGSQLHRLL